MALSTQRLHIAWAGILLGRVAVFVCLFVCLFVGAGNTLTSIIIIINLLCFSIEKIDYAVKWGHESPANKWSFLLTETSIERTRVFTFNELCGIRIEAEMNIATGLVIYSLFLIGEWKNVQDLNVFKTSRTEKFDDN